MRDNTASAAIRPEVRVLGDIAQLPAHDWNALGTAPYPFLRHEFLAALEREGCLGEAYGWLPQHLAAFDSDGRLIGAVPLYLKFNSYGEFVFDWSWADAYQRQGLRYYPKLVSASPYTPATGPKLLLHPETPAGTRRALVESALNLAERLGVSSLHWLFTTPEETDLLEQDGFLRRVGCQFHWRNHGYADFDQYLGEFASAKRKNIRKERRSVSGAGVRFRLLDGHGASPADWATFHRFYESTFDRRGGIPTLSLGFFQAIAQDLPDSVLLVMAEHGGAPVAAAFCLVGEDTLYGRHWGCAQQFDNLHFEACYYQGLDFCIARGLQRFEPGAQGEHKISRGFLPVETRSAHWIAEPRFRRAIAQHLEYEREGMVDYMAEMHSHSPFRSDLDR